MATHLHLGLTSLLLLEDGLILADCSLELGNECCVGLGSEKILHSLLVPSHVNTSTPLRL